MPGTDKHIINTTTIILEKIKQVLPILGPDSERSFYIFMKSVMILNISTVCVFFSDVKLVVFKY